MPKTVLLSESSQSASPNYLGLVQFLISPLLESPESLSVDCEQFNHNQRVWIRLAFEESDKGRVYGRGGRNLQAIRTVLATAAALAGQSLYLEIYESSSEPKRRENHYQETDQRQGRRRPLTQRSAFSKPSIKSRSLPEID